MAHENRVLLAGRIREMLAEAPRSFYEVLQRLESENYRTVLQAWGDLRAEIPLMPDARGRYSLPNGTGSG